EPTKPGAKQPPPPWLPTFWLVGLAVTLLLLFLPSMSTTSPTSLTYTDWQAKVDANQVKTASISPSGQVTGQLTTGTRYTSRIPTAIPNDTLGADLKAHNVAVKAVANPSGG